MNTKFRTGSRQREIPMALLIAIESSRSFVSCASGFLQNQPEIMSTKRKIIIWLEFFLVSDQEKLGFSTLKTLKKIIKNICQKFFS